MANYSKSTDFASKDALLSGDPSKIIKGAEINDEFDAIQTAVNSKANVNSPALTGVPTAPTASAGTANTQLATTAFVINAIYPVGSVYTNASTSINPATLFGFGTWQSFGTGRVLVGVDSGDTAFDTLGETGGSKNAVVVSHTHTAALTDAGDHQHLNGAPIDCAAQYPYGSDSGNPVSYFCDTNGTSATNALTASTGAHTHDLSIDTVGSSGTNANLQPYVTVYMWKRTA